MNGGDHHSTQHDEASHLHTSPDLRPDTQEGVELQGTMNSYTASHAENPAGLREVWKQGEGVDIPPPGQAQEPPRPADERV
jgi:hypothetical protein